MEKWLWNISKALLNQGKQKIGSLFQISGLLLKIFCKIYQKFDMSKIIWILNCLQFCHKTGFNKNLVFETNFSSRVSIVVVVVLVLKSISNNRVLMEVGFVTKQFVYLPIHRELEQFSSLWLLSVAFWKIITALKSHMTCYSLNLNSFFTNFRNL